MNAPGYATSAASQSLMLADDLMPAVRTRDKTVTVRTGRRGIKKGLLRLESAHDTAGSCIVSVTQIAVSSLKDVPQWALTGEGLSSVEELFGVLKRYYR